MTDEKRTDTPEQQGDVLGISHAAPPQTEADRELASEPRSERRRRADDLAGQDEMPESDTGVDDPRGLHVKR